MHNSHLMIQNVKLFFKNLINIWKNLIRINTKGVTIHNYVFFQLKYSNRITADVMVTSDDLIPAVSVQTQLGDTSRFPYMFALLAILIDRTRMIARASPAPCFFRPFNSQPTFIPDNFDSCFWCSRTIREMRREWGFCLSLYPLLFFFLSYFYYLILCIIFSLSTLIFIYYLQYLLQLL